MSAAASRSQARTGPFATMISVVVGIFTRNLGVKIAALVMAAVVWFTVRQDITLTATFPVQIRGLSAADLEPHGLMPVGRHETDVQVTFEGPRSEIDKIRKGDRARIILRVAKADLLGEARRTLPFSLNAGNVEHRYGDSVVITSMEPKTIQLEVAVKVKKKLPVRRPTFDGSLGEWSLDGEIGFTQEILVSGPKGVLDRLEEVEVKPIPIGEFLRGNGEEVQRTLEGVLDLADDLEKDLVRAGRGEIIEYSATFVRSRVPRMIKVPFFVKYESPFYSVQLVIDQGGIVSHSDDDGRTIKLEFTGREADLEAIEKGAKEKTIRAYIRAEDSKDFVAEQVGGGGTFLGIVRLEMPEDLYRSVKVTQPTAREIQVTIESIK